MVSVEQVGELLLILLRFLGELVLLELDGEVIVFNMAKLWTNIVQLNHDVGVAVQRSQPGMIQQLVHSFLVTQTIPLLALQQLHTNTRTPRRKLQALLFIDASSGKFYRLTGFL